MESSETLVRRGRPPANKIAEGASIKKKSSGAWRPASTVVIDNKDPNYRTRLCRKDPTNIAKKKEEGWEVCTDHNDASYNSGRPKTGDFTQLTSVKEGSDWILMRLPNEIAEQRDAYHAKINAERAQALAEEISAGDGVESSAVNISRGQTIIE